MEYLYAHQDRQNEVLENFKRNDDIFRNTMERIFQKYSNLDDPGPDVCFETMTFRTNKGAVPIDSREAEHELQQLRHRVNAEQSLLVLDSSDNKQALSEQDMDETQRTENDFHPYSQKENGDDSLWSSTAAAEPSLNSVSGSQSCLWGEQSQPEEEDEDLERTLNSNGSTLLDVYPSMLNQIGEACRRQQVTQAASAVLRRYRRQRWQSSKAQHSYHIPSNSLNCTLDRTMENTLNVRCDMTSHREGSSSSQEAAPRKHLPLKTIRNSSPASSRNNQEFPPLKIDGSSYLDSGRYNQALSPLKAIRNSSLASNRCKQVLSPLNVIRNSTFASSRSNSELSPLKAIRNSTLASSRSNSELSPLKAIRNSPLASSRSNSELSPLKAIRNSPLASSRSNSELSPLKAIRNSPLASSRSISELSPLKAMRNSPLAFSRSNQELSPLKAIRNSSLASSACFYSPRRGNDEEIRVAESRSQRTGSFSRLDSEPQHQPVRVLDLSTPPSSAGSSPRSPSPDLNQTYNIEPVAMPTSCGDLASAVFSPSRKICNSPLKGAKNSLLAGQGGRSVTASSSHRHPQLGQQFTRAFVGREHYRDHLYSPSPTPQQALIGNPCSGGRSPFKPKVFSQEVEQQTPSSVYCPKQTLPANHADGTEEYSVPYRSLQEVSSFPCHSHSTVSDHQKNVAMAEAHQLKPRPPMRQRSFSGHHFTSCSMSCASRQQIDAEFRRLYHHFICQATSSSCPTSSCHLCERPLEVGVQSAPTSSMSALALTPIQGRLRKRRRQPEVEETLRLKRFRESGSPISHTYRWPEEQQQQQQQHHQSSKYMSPAVANPSEERHTWNRAVLLQCPSPGFLRARQGIRRVSESKPGLNIQSHSPSRRDVAGCVGAVEARSPMRTWNQSGISLSPSYSMSKRRLLYGPLQ